jgi:pseudaminic acid cytidylyltransferase
MKRIFCIIPARSGSKRIKNKNILKFYGVPLIGRTIETAKKTKIFEKIIVSSDSRKIIGISKKYGAKSYGLREKKYSGDKITINQSLLREILKYNLKDIDIFCCIYPATPLLDQSMLINAYKKFIKGNYDSLISVTKYDYPIFRALKVVKKNVNFFWKKFEKKMTQDLEETVHDCGYFYFFKTKNFIKNKKIITKNTGFYEIPRNLAIDIDTKIDLKIAKKLFTK